MRRLSLLLCGDRWPLVDGRTKGGDDAVHDEALALGGSPAAYDFDDVAGAEGVVGVVYEVLFWFFKVLHKKKVNLYNCLDLFFFFFFFYG